MSETLKNWQQLGNMKLPTIDADNIEIVEKKLKNYENELKSMIAAIKDTMRNLFSIEESIIGRGNVKTAGAWFGIFRRIIEVWDFKLHYSSGDYYEVQIKHTKKVLFWEISRYETVFKLASYPEGITSRSDEKLEVLKLGNWIDDLIDLNEFKKEIQDDYKILYQQKKRKKAIQKRVKEIKKIGS